MQILPIHPLISGERFQKPHNNPMESRTIGPQVMSPSETAILNDSAWSQLLPPSEELMAALIDAIDIKRKMFFEFENTPFHCLDVEVSTPTARGGQTLVRIKMRNLITRAVFDKTFKASDKFKEPDLEMVPASYLYGDGGGFYFMDQESYDTVMLSGEMIGDASDFLAEGLIIQLHKYNGNPIGLQLPPHVEMTVTHTEPGVRGDTSSGSVTKPATLETGLEIRVPLFIKEGEKVKVSTETREFEAGFQRGRFGHAAAGGIAAYAGL